MIRIPNGHILLPQDVDHLSILSEARVTIVKGKAKAMTSPELFLDYNGGVLGSVDSGDLKRMSDPKRRVDRNFDSALAQRVEWAVQHGFINRSRSDEPKLRFDDFTLSDGLTSPNLTLSLGPSHWLEHVDTNYRCMNDPAAYGRLTAKGQRNFGDERAYFADCIAVNTVLQGSDDRYFLCLRSRHVPFWPHRWHNVGGFYVPNFALFEPHEQGEGKDHDDPPNPKSLRGGTIRGGSKMPRDEGIDEEIFSHLKVAGVSVTQGDSNVTRNILTALTKRVEIELTEELGLGPKILAGMRMKQIGVSYGISSVDFNYEARLELDSHKIWGGRGFQGEKPELSGFATVTFGELVDVLSGKKVLSHEDIEYVARRPHRSTTPQTLFAPTGLAGLLIHVGLKDKDALKSILATPQYQFYG